VLLGSEFYYPLTYPGIKVKFIDVPTKELVTHYLQLQKLDIPIEEGL